MSKIAIGIGGMAAGLVAGFAFGYWLALDRLEAEYQNNLEDFKESFEKSFKKDPVEKNPLNDFKPRVSPAGIYKNSLVVEEIEGAEETMEAEEDISDEPYIIGPNQYYYERTDFQKVEWFFYQKDKVICDGGNNKIPDDLIKTSIGDDFIEDLEENSMVFIRNESLEKDYVINAIQDSFNKTEEKPKKPRKPSSKKTE